MIEWILGLLLIFWAMFSGNKQQIGKGQAHNFFWQFFAWNFIFFVLALLMRGKNTGKAAVMIGALLVLSLVLLNATNITAFSKLFANAKSLNTSPTSGSGGTGTTQQGAAAPTTNPVVNAADKALHDVTHLPQSLSDDLLNNPVGQFINPLTNPITKPVLHFLEGLF
jgi:hypothetical protein